MTSINRGCQYGLLCLLLAVGGCAPQQHKPTAVAIANQPAKPVVRETPAQIRARRIAILLHRAEQALAHKQLLQPQYNNAYDYYAAVLAIDSDNQDAKLGMQAIVLRYLDMARTAAQGSHFAKAKTYLQRASEVAPDNPRVQKLVAEQRKQTRVKPKQPPLSEDAVRLNAKGLREKSQELKTQLARLAERARSHNKMVLIVTGNDASGRWIYQTMRKAVQGYLLHADIRRGGPPRIEFLPLP